MRNTHRNELDMYVLAITEAAVWLAPFFGTLSSPHESISL